METSFFFHANNILQQIIIRKDDAYEVIPSICRQQATEKRELCCRNQQKEQDFHDDYQINEN